MKYGKLLIVIACVIVFLIIVLLGIGYFLSIKSAPSSAPFSTNPFADAVQTGTANQTDSPATFSVNFYKWYIGNRETDPSFPSTDQLASSFTQWMTPAFILKYQSEVGDVNIDADPILFAQDDPRGWGAGITGTVVSQTDTSSSVQVVIGSGSLAHTYTLQLIKSNGQWLIDSIGGTY
jgi:ribosomal protein L21E